VPFAVVASAGTVATGVVDPLSEIADLCAEQELWMHVDGAYGGPALLADDLRPSFAGIERTDSVAFDPHKWLYTPLAGGCVVVRRMADLAESFDADASYIVQDKEYTQHGLDLGRHGPQFSRSFWALKVWVSLLAHGRRAYARRISHDAALARYLGARAEERPEFELAAPVGLSICCFRYVPRICPEGAGRDEYLDDLNHRLMTEIQLDGRVHLQRQCSGTVCAPRVHRELPYRGRRTSTPSSMSPPSSEPPSMPSCGRRCWAVRRERVRSAGVGGVRAVVGGRGSRPAGRRDR
jgi:glutamate/tyrosine decarboxylase-like PLP-dependent enzyme